jgi:hypothetical protein
MRNIPLTLLQTSQRNAINTEWLVIVAVSLLPNSELDKNEILHIPDAVERKTQFFLPNGVKSVVFDNRGPEGDRPGRRNAGRAAICRRGIFRSGSCGRFRKERRVRPIRDMERDLDEGVHD